MALTWFSRRASSSTRALQGRVEPSGAAKQKIGKKDRGRMSIRRRVACRQSRGKGPRPSKGDTTMRFMVIVKATKKSESGALPDEKMLAAMGKFNEELAKAGVLLDLSGLKASSKGARVRFSGSKRTVIDGPFPETKE